VWALSLYFGWVIFFAKVELLFCVGLVADLSDLRLSRFAGNAMSSQFGWIVWGLVVGGFGLHPEFRGGGAVDLLSFFSICWVRGTIQRKVDLVDVRGG